MVWTPFYLLISLVWEMEVGLGTEYSVPFHIVFNANNFVLFAVETVVTWVDA